MRRIVLMTLIALASAGVGRAQDSPAGPKSRVYVGTYTNAGSKGIYLLEFDAGSGTLTPRGVAAESPSPSFLAVRPGGKFLYAANEVADFEGQKSGAVSAFAIDPEGGMLTLLNRRSSGGAGPCYLVVDPSGAFVLVANYSGGSLSVLPIGPDGRLGEATATVQHRGSGVDKARQASPHAHSIDLDATGRLAVAADLGLDKLMVYRFDPSAGTLAPNARPFASLAPGSGPRHFAFHPDGHHAFAINEMASTVTAFEFDAPSGAFSELQTISSREPGAARPGNSTAEILVHPSGRFLYGSNRGDDNLAIYAIDPASARLTLVGHQPTGGKTPRSFGIDPTGRYLLAANQDSGTVVVFRIDPQSGRLRQVGDPAAVPSPVCVKFVPIGG